MIELRNGPWWEVLSDVDECDTLITDPPYSMRIAEGVTVLRPAGPTTVGIDYGVLSEQDCRDLAAHWAPRTKRWAVIFADHVAWVWHEAAWREAGWYTFAPVIYVRANPPPRFCADGPTSAVDHVLVARPHRKIEPEDRGSRPGWYRAGPHQARLAPVHLGTVTGSKCIKVMRQIVREYSREGDLIVDPYAGAATTLRAAGAECRSAIGAEIDPDTFRDALSLIGPCRSQPWLSGVDPQP